jgi:hypothetical protein
MPVAPIVLTTRKPGHPTHRWLRQVVLNLLSPLNADEDQWKGH